jgi:hypothetical protein
MHTILIAGAALVGLPILLHLIMRQEPKRLTFPAFRFLTQKLKTNQRKLRLRHFILLALRMLLIALFCLALYQPTLLSERLKLSGETPVATVIVVDTSPSMGYTANEKTRFEEAKRRALELIDTLPDKSPVAVVETDDLTARWMDKTEARKAIEQLDKPQGGSQPVTSGVAVAYQLLGKIETDVEEGDRLPKLVAVFTDRTASSWDRARAEEIKKLQESLPDPKPAHIVFDVGADHPNNVAILAAEMKPQVLAANEIAHVTVTVAATGPANEPPVEATIKATIKEGLKVIPAAPKSVTVPYGQTRAVAFEFPNLKPGVHQVQFELAAHDRLQFDDFRFLTFKVGAARLILTIAETEEAAEFWQRAHWGKDGFGCLVVTPNDVFRRDGVTLVRYPNPEDPDGEPLTDDIRAFDVVCLLGIRDPSLKPDGFDTLWDKIVPYVERGGKLIVVPGDERLSLPSYADPKLQSLMPGTLKRVIDTREVQSPPPLQPAPGWNPPRDGQNGVTWFLSDDKVLQHPMLRPFLEWRKLPNVDVWQNPRVARKYWEVEKSDGASVIVHYNDSTDPAKRRPAVLERGVPDPDDNNKIKGKVILLTTRLDTPPGAEPWHDYWETEGSTWYAVFPWLLERYLAGDAADANFNYLTGQTVTVPLPKGGVPRGLKVAIQGPGITSENDLMEVGERQIELRVGPPRTNLPGNFELSVDAAKWKDGFSLNVPAEESTLEKVPVEVIEDLAGKDSVVPLDKNRDLREAIAGGGKHPIDLFPWLLIAVLFLLALEGLIANRFYRRVR